jgi:hypothetical protein
MQIVGEATYKICKCIPYIRNKEEMAHQRNEFVVVVAEIMRKNDESLCNNYPGTPLSSSTQQICSTIFWVRVTCICTRRVFEVNSLHFGEIYNLLIMYFAFSGTVLGGKKWVYSAAENPMFVDFRKMHDYVRRY